MSRDPLYVPGEGKRIAAHEAREAQQEQKAQKKGAPQGAKRILLQGALGASRVFDFFTVPVRDVWTSATDTSLTPGRRAAQAAGRCAAAGFYALGPALLGFLAVTGFSAPVVPTVAIALTLYATGYKGAVNQRYDNDYARLKRIHDPSLRVDMIIGAHENGQTERVSELIDKVKEEKLARDSALMALERREERILTSRLTRNLQARLAA